MTKYICEKAKECTNQNCKDKKPHEYDNWCEKGCDSIFGNFPEAKCIIVNPTGIELIAEERKRQIEKEGWDDKHDAEHTEGQLAIAAACYAFDVGSLPTIDVKRFVFDNWPWSKKWWKPTPDDPIRQLAKAGALIAAEIDRLQRMKDKNANT